MSKMSQLAQAVDDVKRNSLQAGDKIHCHSWRNLKQIAFALSSEGYGVAVVGFADMSDNVLTITADKE